VRSLRVVPILPFRIGTDRVDHHASPEEVSARDWDRERDHGHHPVHHIGIGLSPLPGIHSAHGHAKNSVEMSYSQSLRDHLVLKIDDIAVIVIWEICFQSVARLAGLAVTDTVRKDQIVAARVERATRIKECLRINRAQQRAAVRPGPMQNEDRVIDIALRIVPDEVCLVPEKREEITTEGGLDVVTQRKELEATIKRLQAAGIRVSLFVDPALEQIDVAAELGVEMVELHTGKLSNAFAEKIEKQELHNLQQAAKAASELKLQVNAGHGINYGNIALIHKIPHLTELNIGHAIISRAIFAGLETAVREMLGAMEDYEG